VNKIDLVIAEFDKSVDHGRFLKKVIDEKRETGRKVLKSLSHHTQIEKYEEGPHGGEA
jgi:hypothetical protein